MPSGSRLQSCQTGPCVSRPTTLGTVSCGVPLLNHQASSSYSQSSLPSGSRRRTWLGDAFAAKCAYGLSGQ
jgi:hypothetical protein